MAESSTAEPTTTAERGERSPCNKEVQCSAHDKAHEAAMPSSTHARTFCRQIVIPWPHQGPRLHELSYFHTTFSHASSHLCGVGGPVGARDAVELGAQDRAGLHQARVRGVGAVEVQRAREALGRAPEEGARRSYGVLGEGVDELRDAVVELVLQGR